MPITLALSPIGKKSGGRCDTTRILRLDDIKRGADFITSYAETHALVLPGRVSSHKRDNILLLPSSCIKADIHRQYQEAMSESEHRCVARSTFRNLWLQLLPRIVCSRPMTDLCWECQRNNRDISSSSNLPDVVKQAKLKKQQAHLDLVFMERTFYQNMVKDAKAAYYAAGCPHLGPHPLVLRTLQCTSVLTTPSRCTFLHSQCSQAPCSFWCP